VKRRTFFQLATAGLAKGQAGPPRLLRKDSFFGMHFDLHPNPNDKALGRDVTEAMVERFLEKVRPDFVQYDCKGHAGWLGYPSKVSDPAPNIVNDSLAVWRKVTARRGVALYIHFSGVWDSLAVKQRPEWARLDAAGKGDGRQTSLFGPYVDERMIPQLLEVSEKYELDGVWVDGECWATNADYSEAAARAYGKPLPRTDKEEGWHEFLEFNRERFRRYVKHYVDTLHAKRPKFQVASNWLYSTMVPERPDLPVDYLSGDYLGNAPIARARLEARYLAANGKPWDLMAWGFQSATNNPVGVIHKPATQLQQEASVVLAQGGGFQVYYQPTRTGHLDDSLVETMAKVGQFCRARQQVSHKTEPIPQVAVLFSKHSLYRTGGKLFGSWGARSNPAVGVLDALIENLYSVDVLPDWKIGEAGAQYPLIVVPEWPDIGDEATRALERYAANGGKLLVIGAENAVRFAGLLGIRGDGAPAEQPAWIGGGEVFANCRGRWQGVELAGAEAIEYRHPSHDVSRERMIAATVRGGVVGFYGPLGTVHAATHAPATRALMRRMASRLFTPKVRVEGPPTLEIALRRKGGRVLLHIANATAMQVASDYAVMDFVPPVGPVKVYGAAREATLAPEGRRVSGSPLVIDQVHVHSVLEWSERG
jgi:hypothetical protein